MNCVALRRLTSDRAKAFGLVFAIAFARSCWRTKRQANGSAHEHAAILPWFTSVSRPAGSDARLVTSHPPYDPGQHEPDDRLLGLDLERSLDQYVEHVVDWSRDSATRVSRLKPDGRAFKRTLPRSRECFSAWPDS